MPPTTVAAAPDGAAEQDTDSVSQHGPAWPWHATAIALVVAGVAVQVARPVAGDLGPPPAPETAFSSAFLARAAAYRIPLYTVAVVAVLVRIAIAVVVAGTPTGRRLVRRIVDRVGDHRPARAAAAVVLTIVVITDLVLLPLAFWAGYVHEGNFGLRTQGVGGWSYDWAVAHLPVWLGLAVLAVVGFWLTRVRPRTWPAVAGVAAGVAGMALAFAAPLVLEPLSYRFTPLPAGAVRDEVQAVVAAAGERIDEIVVADASRRALRQNAYISGLGSSRRVVLYDTLLEGRPPAEIGVVLAHELAHQRHGDIWRLALLGGAGTVITAYVVAGILRRRVTRGQQGVLHDPRAAGAVVLTVLLLNLASQPVQSLISRRAETAADLVSLELTRAPAVFVTMQQGLAEANLAEPKPPRWFALWRGSHPTPMARIGMGRGWQSR